MGLMLKTIGLLCLYVLLGGCEDPDIVPETHISTPPAVKTSVVEVERFPHRTALFGDLHVHTSWSGDAYAGANRLGPNMAYRFAKGEKIELQTGDDAQLQTPLDFVALTDHAEGFDTQIVCTMPGSPEFDLQQCRTMRSGEIDQVEMLERAFSAAGVRPMPRMSNVCGDEDACKANELDTWQRVQAVANAHDEPGRFTALIGYEFSSLLKEFGMLHRNVIFRGTDVVPRAISSIDVVNQKDFFWIWNKIKE